MENVLFLHVKVLYLLITVLSVLTVSELWMTYKEYVGGGQLFMLHGEDHATAKLGKAKRAVEPVSRPELSEDASYPGISSYVGQRSKRQSNTDYELCQRILINCNFKIQGPPGPKGGRGNNGLPGSKGDKGERGYTGVVGSTGAPGQKGTRGDPGIPGPIGIRGPEGRQGNIGNPGSPGRQGNKGNKGEPGEQGPKGYQGVVGFPGKKGPTGEKGSKGEQGINGPVGYVGPMGQKGEKGDIGRNGTQGEKGRRGRHGKRGPNGPEGERGPEGVQGEPGIKGEKGDPGPRSASDNCSCPKGDKGEKGQRGLIGFTGYKGDKGESGRKGDLGHGIRGSDGPQGPPGTKGVKGDKGDCDVISSIAMENRISETKNPYITNKPNCRDETTTEVKTTTVLTTSEPPTTTPVPTTTTKPPTATTRPKLAARSRDCYIKKIGTPMFERKFGPRIGAWMRENRYTWVTNGESGKYLHEFRSKASFMSNEDDQTIDLKSYEYHGNNHAVYKGSFYFHWRDGMIVCYDLHSKSVVTSTILDDADVGTNLYKGSSSNFDIEVDEHGLWIIYANKYDSEHTHIIKIDPHTMITLQKWRIAVTPGSHGNAFVAGGVVYFVKDTRKRLSSIDYAFDLFYNKPIRINTRFVNPFGYNTMISYSGSANFRARKIYGWDNGAQIVYPLLFYCVE